MGATSGRGGGYGATMIGLSIVKAVVDGHEGSVDIESEELVGTIAQVRLPLAEMR